MSDSLQPHGLQHTSLPCPSSFPTVYSDSFPLSQWCHPTSSSSIIPFSSCRQSFPASGSFPVSQLFVSGGQSIGASASTSVLPINIQGWFPLELTGLISLMSKGVSRVFSRTTQWKNIALLKSSLGTPLLSFPNTQSLPSAFPGTTNLLFTAGLFAYYNILYKHGIIQSEFTFWLAISLSIIILSSIQVFACMKISFFF